MGQLAALLALNQAIRVRILVSELSHAGDAFRERHQSVKLARHCALTWGSTPCAGIQSRSNLATTGHSKCTTRSRESWRNSTWLGLPVRAHRRIMITGSSSD